MLFVCSKCDHAVKQKKSAIWHYLRVHVEVNLVPFSCSLCGYRAMKYSQLKNHIKGYQNHWMRKLTCLEMKDEEFFQRSLNPYHVVLGRDVLVRGGSEEQTMEEEVRRIAAEEEEEEKENREPAEQRGVEEEKENKGCSEETVEEVAEESGEKGQDLLERAITLCDINEEVEFSPDYEEEEEEEEEIVTEEKEEEIIMVKKVEEKCVQTEMVWEDVERKRRMENRGFGDYIERLEKKLREKDREIERLREQLKRERDSRQEFGVDGSYGMDEFEEMWASRGSPEKKRMKSVVFRPERSRRY